MWVNVPKSRFCQGSDRNCSDAGTFNPEASSTNTFVNHGFIIRYVDKISASGDFVTDDLHFAGQELKNVQFGLGLVSSSGKGFIGIGYAVREGYVTRMNGKPFPNLPQVLKNQGLIKTNAYSLWLNDRKASHGSLSFGGVDTAKFHGNLTTLPIEKTHGQFEKFYVNLTDIHFTNATGSKKIMSGESTPSLPVLLDSGSTLMHLPKDLTSKIFSRFRVHKDTAVLDCGLRREKSTLDFTFATAKISVPMSELVLPIPPDQDGNERTADDGTRLCRLGITSSVKPTSSSSLGDTFLRSAYVVYDITNNEISIAPTNFNAVDSNIVEIGTGDEIDILNHPGTATTATTTTPTTTQSSSAATPPPTNSSATMVISNNTSSAMHYSWSIFTALGGVLACIASA